MDISRLKRVLAGFSAGAIMVSQIGTAIAAYSDVPAGIWYEDAVNAFVDDGLLDAAQTRFRGGELANRAEFVKLIVELNGGILGTAPATATFDDVGSGAWYYGYFEEAAKENWVRGDGSCAGTHPCYARPSANINRAEAAAIIVRAFPELTATGDAPQFADNPSGQWYTDVIQTAADNCVLQGDEGTGRVRPSDNMNRAEMVVMLHRVNQGLVYGEDCGGGPVAEAGISDAVATSANVVEVSFNVTLDQTSANDKTKYTVTGTGEQEIASVKLTSSDTVEITLTEPMNAGAEYTVSVEDMMAADGEKFSDSATFSGYTAIVKGDGTLEVSASSKSPVGDTVPKGAVGVTMASLDLTATADDVSIENLTVLHEGFGDTTDISGVYAVVNGERVTRKRSFDSQTTTATIRFTKPLVVKKGQTVTVDVAVDFTSSATTASEHTATVELASDFISNAKEVKGNFPVRGATFRVAAVAAGSVSVAYRSVTPSQIKVGDKAALVGKFEFSLDPTEDQTIYSVTLENDGTTSDGDIVNLQIVRTDGTVVANTVAATIADFATFVFDPPLTILEGDKLTLNVKADIVGGAAKTVKMHFDESSDIFAVGSLYGYGVSSQLYGSLVQLPTETTTLPTTVNIDAGQFTININGPTTQNYTPDDDDAVLANISFDSGGQEDVDIEELYIAIQGTTATGAEFSVGRAGAASYDEPREALQGVELRSKTTGRTISGIIPDTSSAVWTGSNSPGSTAGAYTIYRFDDFTIAGKEQYEFRVDFLDNSATTNAAPKNGDRFRIHICGEPTYVLDSANNLTSNSTTCDFSGLVTASTTYQMKVTGVSTNDRIGDVRPRGTISGNFQDIKTSALTLTGRPQASTDVSVSNAKNINLLRFEARASEAKDVLLTDIIFYAGAGSLNNGNNYALWVDTNADGNVDTVLESGVASSNGSPATITFSKIQNGGYVVPKETTVVFEVHGDIASSLTSSTLQLQFATGSTFVQAEEADNGSSLSNLYCTNPSGTQRPCPSGTTNALSASQIVVSLASSTVYSLRSQGDLYVSKSTNPIRNRQLLGGKLEDEILRLQFHAEYEDIDVTDLIFTGSGTTVSANGFGNNVDSLELYKVGATTPFGTATVGGCSSTTDVLSNSMCANLDNKQFVVPRGADVDILVRPRMKTDEQGAHSGSGVLLYIDPTATSWSGSGAVRARGLQSSNNLSGSDGDATAEGEVFIGRTTVGVNAEIEGNLNRVVLSKVVSITNANPDPNGTAIASGTQPIGQFKFTAATHGNTKNGSNDWTLSGIIFNVNATNVLLGDSTQVTPAGTDFRLYNKANNSVKAVCQAPATSTSANAQSGSIVVICGDVAAAGVNTELNSGEDQTFVLEALVSNPKIANTNSTLQVSLTSFTSSTATTMTSATNHIMWKDKDSGYSTNFFWVDYPETTVNSTSYQS